MNKPIPAGIISWLLLLLLTACAPEKTPPAVEQEAGVKYARGFAIFSLPGEAKRIDVFNPWQGADGVRYSYYALPRGSETPDSLKQEVVIKTPVKRIVCMSTTHVGFLDALSAGETICGISGAQYVYNREVREKYENGSVKDVGYGTNLNYELLVQLDPDVVFLYGVGSEAAPVVHKMKDMGINVLLIGEYLEEKPLAKAEWIKCLGVLLRKEAAADSVFRSVAREYNAVAGRVRANAGEKPLVLAGMPFRDVWYVSPADTYLGSLIRDAGGAYLWEELKGNTAVPMGLEQVFLKGRNADIWIHTGTAGSLQDIKAANPRLALLKPVKDKKLYNNNRRLSQGGGNDYWESGVMKPHILLKDLVRLFHPELLPEHRLKYYKPLEY